jgi:phosphoribosyl 1,2-cyclic phosphate phosphodiesterase
MLFLIKNLCLNGDEDAFTFFICYFVFKKEIVKITILGSGTSQGVPVIACECIVCRSNDPRDKRLRSSILIESENTTIVIDAGPDFRQQLLREQVKKLDAILITHTHKDHVAGLDDVRSFNYLTKRPMKVYASKFDQEEIVKEFSYAFEESPYPGVPRISFEDLSESSYAIGDISFLAFKVLHHQLEVFGFRLNDFAYITDANFIPESSMKKLEGIKVLVVDALRKEKHISHFNLQEAISLAQRLQVEQTYFTHVSHLMGLHSEVQKQLPDNMSLAWDGLQIKV